MDRQTSPIVWMNRCAVFLGSFLLFLVQPMLGRTLLPMFGGSATIWGVCLAAYQLLLLGGYLYAHQLAQRPLRTQRRFHLTALLAGAGWLAAVTFCRPSISGWLSGAPDLPWIKAAAAVLLFVGFPYLLLAAGSTLVQSWAARTQRNVYSLYVWSNTGSFLGLLSYPFILEPWCPLTTQWLILTAGVALYIAALALLTRTFRPTAAPDGTPPAESGGSRPTAERGWTWVVLPAASSFLLNAVVAHLFMDVTPLPLVWVTMLSAFLLSYILGFSRFGYGYPKTWTVLAILSLIGAAFANGRWGTGSFYPNAAAGIALLIAIGTFLHSWLYEERPDPAKLTRYYLASSIGGAIGGLLASFAAPLLFKRVTEYPLALCACAFLIACKLPKPAGFRATRTRTALWCLAAAGLCLALISATARRTGSRVLYRARNFYGTLSVTKTVEVIEKRPAQVAYLWYGQTTHGMQVTTEPMRYQPLSYYTPAGGGAAVLSHPNYQQGKEKPMTVGIVGLGAGVLAAYGREGDLYRFFEINPLVTEVACNRNLFTYLLDSDAKIDLVPGDARNMLAKESAANDPLYDVLYIDAYNGDAVPYHLITEEAFRIYVSRLAQDGILAVHVSNWHIDLLPLCKSMANKLNLYTYGTISVEEQRYIAGCIWVYMTRKPLKYITTQAAHPIDWMTIRPFPVPTDEKGSLLPLIR